MEYNNKVISNHDVRKKAFEIIKTNGIKILPIIFVFRLLNNLIQVIDKQRSFWEFSQNVRFDDELIFTTDGFFPRFVILSFLVMMIIAIIMVLINEGMRFGTIKQLETGEAIDSNDLFGLITGKFMPFGRSIKTLIAIYIFTTLWSLLFVIPGIVKSFAYSLAYFVMYMDNYMDATDSLKESQKLMDGFKLDYFFIYAIIGAVIGLTIFAMEIGMKNILPVGPVSANLYKIPSTSQFQYFSDEVKSIVNGFRLLTEREAILAAFTGPSSLYYILISLLVTIQDVFVTISTGVFIKLKIFNDTEVFTRKEIHMDYDI